ncbi:SIS domain-containing protein [Candidatus Woesearchaeota archaeon]|nr:SIS domain-containing protein [Candidatus Woesearchaeota archaeon]
MTRDDLGNIRLYFQEKIAILEEMQEPEILRDIKAIVDSVWDTYEKGGVVYACANGGPAGSVENLLTDLSLHPFVSDDKSKATGEVKRLRTYNLNSSPGTLTGLTNDLGYDNVFRGQLEGIMGENDLIIGFSGSGNSGNVLRAFEYATSVGAETICVSGRGGGKANEYANLNIIVPGTSEFPGQTGGNDNNFHIEDLQFAISHVVTGLIKERVQNKDYNPGGY